MTEPPSSQIDLNERKAVYALTLNLLTDLACSENQAMDRYGLDLETLETTTVLPGFIRPTRREVALSHRSRTAQPVTFLCADSETATLETWQLRHLAGLFAARHRLGVPGADWRVTAFGRAERDRDGRWLPDCIPDAIWEADWGRIALEYDAGSHRLETVSEKARVYANNYDQQLWLAATAERCASLRWALETTLPDRSTWRVMRVDWR